MREKRLKQDDITVTQSRLEYHERERVAIDWLLRPELPPYGSNIELIKRGIFCMDKGYFRANYEGLDDGMKKRADLLIQHEDVVNLVLGTVFQWFGSSVGREDVGKLLDELRMISLKKGTEEKIKEVCGS